MHEHMHTCTSVHGIGILELPVRLGYSTEQGALIVVRVGSRGWWWGAGRPLLIVVVVCACGVGCGHGP